ncbi:hypothetical protein AGMMS50212_02960 [Spirochaetia bacterium]|nr:hypothetical protein AGMMS50212_02960 [Spirochaetia bacterium]
MIVGCNSVIGAEGFQVLKDKKGDNFIASHSGGCKLCENVYIGNNTVIAKSIFEGYTLIGKNTKIADLVCVSHNVSIGENSVLTAGVIIAGGVTVEDNIFLGINSCVNNKVVIERDAFIRMGSVVIGNVNSGVRVVGNPARPQKIQI